MESSTLPAKDVVTQSRAFVMCVVFDEREHKEEDVKIGKETVKRCSIFKTISCEDHVNVYKGGRNAFENVASTPTVVLADPDGKEISRKVGAPGSTELVEMMKAAVKKVGPGITTDEWAKTQAEIAKAKEDLEKGKIQDAIKVFEKLGKAKNEGLKGMGAEGMAAVNDKGNKAIDEAIGMSMEDAKKALKKIIADYKGSDAGKRAADELKRLEGAPKPDR